MIGDQLNAELELGGQRGLYTPNDRFYRRSNLPIPDPPDGFSVDGLVLRPLSFVDLSRYPVVRLAATLECAGNGRSFLSPAVEGEPWNLGAVSTAEWAGVRLRDVLDEAGVRADAVEARFDGNDGFRRSLPIADAVAPEALLVNEMNGEPLPVEHGGPVRLLVAGWYGMAAVKWLRRVELVAEPFRGHFQVERYVIDGRPLREMEVRAVIVAAEPGRVRGYAWTGRGEVTRVEVSDDGGESFRPARLLVSAGRFAWVEWEAGWTPAGPGEHSLLARARDSAGRVQPLEQNWNQLGYANNAAQPFRVITTDK